MAAGRVEVATRPAGARAGADVGHHAPWAAVVPDDTYRRHAAFASIVVALGDAGGFYVDDITIAVSGMPSG